MPDKKITQLTEMTAPTGDDLLAIVDSPGASPVTKKITVTNLGTSHGHAATSTEWIGGGGDLDVSSSTQNVFSITTDIANGQSFMLEVNTVFLNNSSGTSTLILGFDINGFNTEISTNIAQAASATDRTSQTFLGGARVASGQVYTCLFQDASSAAAAANTNPTASLNGVRAARKESTTDYTGSSKTVKATVRAGTPGSTQTVTVLSYRLRKF